MKRVERWVELGVISPLGLELARALGRLVPGTLPEVLLGVAFASRAVERGHVCVDLSRLLQTPLLDNTGALVEESLPPRELWLEALRGSPLVSCIGSVSAPEELDDEGPRPLVLDGEGRLYLRRYFQYQRRLAQALGARLCEPVDVDEAHVGEALERMFPRGPRGVPDLQRLGALLATLWKLTVISGGPGTGKTSTVVKVLAVLTELALARNAPPPRTLLLAPTGKAAQRLNESVTAQLPSLATSPAVKRALEHIEAATVHRALGFLPRTPTRFRHHPGHALPADIVLVDESSMVDLALMTKLVEAVSPKARLILLGDKDQLASVEAGAILGDIYNADANHTYSSSLAQKAKLVADLELGPKLAGKAAPGPQDCMVHLSHSYRYRSDGGIGALARAINAGDSRRATQLLSEGAGRASDSGDSGPTLELVDIPSRGAFGSSLELAVVEGFRPVVEAPSAAAKLEALTRFRVLAGHRHGERGSELLSSWVERTLQRAGLLRDTQADGSGLARGSFENRPLLITENDYQLELFNGDVGVLARSESGALRAFFATAGGGLKAIAPMRLPPHETVFAMTVHKSQGSEFDHVVLMLPSEPSPLMTRELIYTAITRAKQRVSIYGSAAVLRHAIDARIERASGLREALWGPVSSWRDQPSVPPPPPAAEAPQPARARRGRRPRPVSKQQLKLPF